MFIFLRMYPHVISCLLYIQHIEEHKQAYLCHEINVRWKNENVLKFQNDYFTAHSVETFLEYFLL